METKETTCFYELDKELICDLKSLELEELDLKSIDELNGADHMSDLSPVSNRLNNVTQLLLDHNDIQSLPSEICKMKSLKVLSLVGNSLKELPEGIGQLSSLVTLKLDENNLHSFPESFNELLNLQTLSAIANKLQFVKENLFSGLKNLKRLFLDENLISVLPTSFGHLINLEVFECSENMLEELPDKFENVSHLEILNLDSNKLVDLPTSFCMLPKLRILLLSNNKIRRLPSIMNSSGTLERLCLEKNDLSELPTWFNDMKRLTDLALDDNELLNKALTEDFCKSACNLENLSAGRNYITELPENIGLLGKLKTLHVGSTMLELERSNFQSGNWLSYLPSSFAKLTNLRKLHLDENQIRELPNDFGDLCHLEWLDLGQNQLEELPESFCKLKSLIYLQISRNRLKVLPEEIGELDKLIELRLDSNVLASIPVSLTKLKMLKSLDLYNNCLIEFPITILSLKNLKRLDLDSNKFSLEDIPRILPENSYPKRDEALKDNWRGKTREDKIKCEVISVPVIEDREEFKLEQNEVYYNENTLRDAMKAGMSLWRRHDGSSQREDFNDEHQKTYNINSQKLLNGHPVHEHEKVPEIGLPALPPANFDIGNSTEDWDEELKKEENYETISDLHRSRNGLTSSLIDPFLNSINRYPPCMQAFSSTACYESFVYSKSPLLENSKSSVAFSEEGQFSDAES